MRTRDLLIASLLLALAGCGGCLADLSGTRCGLGVGDCGEGYYCEPLTETCQIGVEPGPDASEPHDAGALPDAGGEDDAGLADAGQADAGAGDAGGADGGQGGCDPGCGTNEECVGSLCICRSDYVRCDGSCVMETTEHCGETCALCSPAPNAEPVCNAGVCEVVCGAGYFRDGAGDCSHATALASTLHETCAILETNEVKCWGLEDAFQTGSSNPTNRPVFIPGLGSVTAIAAGSEHFCALKTTGKVACWGSNDFGQLGDGTTNLRTSPTVEVDLNGGIATLIATGAEHTCAAVPGRVYCWGNSGEGRLGAELSDAQTSASSVLQFESMSLSSLALGDCSTCVIQGTSQDLRCLGCSPGSGVLEGRVELVDVSSQVSSYASRNGTHCLISTGTGNLACWGNNDHGQANPLSGETDVPSPVEVVDLGAGGVAIGTDHACALVDGRVDCWGNNDRGQLGGEPYEGFVGVEGLSEVTQLSAGDGFTCALMDGAVICWGKPLALGQGSGSTVTGPIFVQDP